MQSTKPLYIVLVLALIVAGISASNSGWLLLCIATLAASVPILIFIRPDNNTEFNLKKWQHVFKDAPAGMAMINMNGKIVASNAAFHKICGLSNQQIKESSIQKIIGESAWQEIAPQTTKLTEDSDASIEYEREFTDANGKLRWIRAYTRVIEHAGNKTNRFAVVQVLDLTEQHKFQVALSASELRFRGIIENIPQMLCIIKSDGSIAYANPSACELLIPDNKNILGTNFESLISKAHQSSFIQALKRCRENPGTQITLDKIHLTNNEFVEIHLTDKSCLEGISGTLIACQPISRHIHAESKLRSSEEKFSTTFHTSLEAILIIRASDSIILDLNTSFTRLLGYTREEVIGTAVIDLRIWANPSERKEMQQILYRDYECLDYEVDLLAKNGEFISTELSLRFVEIEGELCVISTGRDVSRRRQAENALLASEEKFARIFSNSPDSIAITRLTDDTILDVNDVFVAGSGFSRDELIGKSFSELGVITGDTRLHSMTANLKERGRVQNRQLEIRLKSGEVIPTLVSATIMELNGESSVLVVIRDNSAQLHTEMKLKRSEERFRKTIENAPIGIMLVEAEGRIFQVNNYASDMLDYQKDELLNKHIFDLLPESHRNELKLTLETLLTNEDSVDSVDSKERLMQCSGGKSIFTNFHIVLQRSDTGNPPYFIVQIADTTELISSQQQMERLAFYDTLTGLPNRRLFYNRLEQCLVSAKRNKKTSAILYLDLDQFKRVNDTLGHNQGDALLREVSSRLQKCMREEDTIARLGGDEFTILLNELSNPHDAGVISEKLLTVLRQPIQLGNHEVVVTTSIGIALIPGDSQEPDVLVKFADLAMYSAKEEGRNNYQYYSANMNRLTHNQLDLENQLRKAIENDEFVLYYQPKVNLKTKKIMGMECLIRWNHPERGFLSPDEFIPLAEETGIIVEIGEWVIREACKAAGIASKVAGYPVNTAINVSPRQFRQHSLVSLISNCIEEYGLEASQLEFETTETTLMNDLEVAADILLRLHQLGVQLAIDDFGTGYSSLQHLKRFPFDIVKIDRSFVMDIPENEDDMAITSAVIAMSHQLHLKVVAEGIENRAQLDYLLANKCEYGQGFYFSKPISLDDISVLLTPGISLLRRADKP